MIPTTSTQNHLSTTRRSTTRRSTARRRHPYRLLATLVAGALVAAACGSDSNGEDGADGTSASAADDTDEATDSDPTSDASTDTAEAGGDDAEASNDSTTSEGDGADGGDDGDEASESTDDETAGGGEPVTLVTYESFPSEGTPVNDALAAFSEETGIDVEILVSGDTGTMLAKAELAAGNPEGDVMWGIDNSFLGRAIEAEIFEPYVADGLDAVPAEFTDLVPDGVATPVDFGDVCLNYDITAFEDLGVAPPTTLDDLLDPTYADLLVVQNPATSSPGLAFLLATIDEYGEDGWQDYWAALADNGVSVTDGWTDAYYGEFSYAGGDRPVVVSYGSSPPFEVLFAETELDAAPTGVVESTCFRQVEFAGVLAGTDQPDEARMLVDFLITDEFQATLPLNVFVFPVNENVELDPAFVDFAVIPETSRSLDPAAIDANRSEWIDQWTRIVIG
ncbi:MAG: thiamine ABC transporter substrate-binding protein [Actinomycetota bacterium]